MGQDHVIHGDAAWFDGDVIASNPDYAFYEFFFLSVSSDGSPEYDHITVLNWFDPIRDSVNNYPVIDIQGRLHRACWNMEGESDKGADDKEDESDGNLNGFDDFG